MRLTSIDLYSNNNQVAALSFKDPRSKNPYVAQNVTGLDADEIVPKFYGTDTGATINHHDLVVNKREIVVLVALNPQFSQGKSYSDLRDDLYRGIATSRDGTIQLRLKNGAKTVAAISGFVTKFETAHFSKTPQVQMTIRCDDGMLRSPEETQVDLIKLSTDVTLVDNVSTAPHGFKFNVTFDAISDDFVIRDSATPTWQFTVTPGTIGADSGFLVNDVLYFSSAYDGKTVYIKRGMDTIYLVDKIAVGSSWPVMFPGPNEMQFVADGAFTWNEFTYYQSYWGV
jgi:hypothetical protein